MILQTIHNMTEVKKGFFQLFINFTLKNTGTGVLNKVSIRFNLTKPNQQLADKLNKPVIRNFKNVKYIHLL